MKSARTPPAKPSPGPPAAEPSNPIARLAAGLAGDCGTGDGGFKPGNKCGCRKHPQPEGRPKQSDPAVQRAHRRIARSGRRESDVHALVVAKIRAGKDEDGKLARLHPKAKEDAEAIASYEPATGHVAVGHLPGRPNEAEARAINRLARQRDRGEDLNDHELAAIADRDVSHVGVRDGWDDSDVAGHRYLVHNRMTGRNEVFSDAELRSSPAHRRAAMLGTPDAPSHLVPIRQFDSQGVEVPLNHERFRANLDPHIALRSRSAYRQSPAKRAEERAASRGVKRAKFGTSDPKS